MASLDLNSASSLNIDNELEKLKSSPKKCYSMYNVILVVIPIIVAIVLRLWFPKYVFIMESEKRKIDWKKFIKWIVIISIVLWIITYGFSKCGIGKKMLCLQN